MTECVDFFSKVPEIVSDYKFDQIKAKCSGCEYLCEHGCLRGNHLPFFGIEEHIKYHGEGGLTVRITPEGVAVYLVDIKWCDKWQL